MSSSSDRWRDFRPPRSSAAFAKIGPGKIVSKPREVERWASARSVSSSTARDAVGLDWIGHCKCTSQRLDGQTQHLFLCSASAAVVLKLCVPCRTAPGHWAEQSTHEVVRRRFSTQGTQAATGMRLGDGRAFFYTKLSAARSAARSAVNDSCVV